MEFKDRLLNHWGIHHLHISSKPGNVEGYNKQKHSELLYIRFVEDQAYLLQILDHTAFTDYDLIKIIHNNWPQTIDNHRAHGISGEKYSKDQLKEFRTSNINTLITIDEDNIYFSLGNGVTMSGHNFFLLEILITI
ncbi:hypothetical protein ACE3MZ_12840 [Paenibacillus sp. WLX1005]|uniref:hypothetical protein n=1 Tax=Paenibacillus sp. WLX1005 TaxID=3243766 RepID=UPI003983E8B2